MKRGSCRRRFAEIAGSASCLLLAAACPVGADQSGDRGIEHRWLREDPRLGRPVTLEMSRVTISELVDGIESQCGIALSTGERDGAGDAHVGLFCRNQPAVRILNALWSLMSCRGGLWRWERTRESGDFRYRLVQPPSARRLRETIKRWVQDRMEAVADPLLSSVDGDEAARRGALESI